jgi:hypothetical protein
MSLNLSETILPLLREAFPGQRMELGPQKHILATFYSPSPEVGCLAIQDDGDEITMFLANRTHFHIGCYDDALTEQQKTEAIAGEVLDFMRKLFSDEIEFFGTGPSGGCREWQSTKRGLLSKLLLGSKSYVWSGPLAQIGKAIAVACKNRGFPFALNPKTHRYIGFDGKHDYLKLTVFNQTGASAAKISRSNHQMPIARRPS